MRGTLRVALGSLLATYCFFFEYLRPAQLVHIPFDLENYNYPLADYAFQALRQGRFPLWDPTIYAGMSFLQNVQTQLFYPPAWIMFLLRWNHDRLSHQAIQDLVIAHVWLAFMLSYLWLRGKRLRELAAILGAGVFAFSGLMCNWMEHIGFIGAFAWMPLGFWGIDQAVEQRSWRPLWKLALASAMSFLAGYPPVWFVFVLSVTAYALAGAWRWKAAIGAAVAGALSLGLVTVQLLPAVEGAALRTPELRYGAIEGPILVRFLTPNFIDTSMQATGPDNLYAASFYLGAPALIAIPLLIYSRRRFRDIAPSLAVLAVTALMMTDPFGLVTRLVYLSVWTADIARPDYFPPGITLAFSALTAYALDSFLKSSSRLLPTWVSRVVLGSLAAWIAFDLVRWFGVEWFRSGFPYGWAGWYDIVIPLVLFAAGLAVVRALPTSKVAAAALVLFIAVNYKVTGTSKRINAAPGPGQTYYPHYYLGMDDTAYRELRANPQGRIVIDLATGPHTSRLRHVGLQTPQGFDPFLSTGLRQLLTDSGAWFPNDRDFQIYPDQTDLLHLLGVRYFITAEIGLLYPKLLNNPNYRHLSTSEHFYQVFEYLDARPSYHGPGKIQFTEWAPERRVFSVNSTQGGEFVLAEQFHPGWIAEMDGSEVSRQPWKNAFISANVPAGEHTLIFEFKPNWQTGAMISAASLVALLAWIALARR